MATPVDTIALQQIATRLDAMNVQLAQIVEKQRKTEEMIAEFVPIVRDMMLTASGRLEDLEKKGYFAFGKEVLGVAQRVVESYSAQDVQQFGDAIVGILDTVRALTQPEILAIAGDASDVLLHADRAAPVGIFGMVRATRDDEVQRGMAVMLELLKHVGRGAQAMAEGKGPRKTNGNGNGKPRLRLEAGSARTGSRALGIERTPRKTPMEKTLPAHTACGTGSEKPAVAATIIDGIEFTADGHMVDANAWTRTLGENIAKLQGLDLTDAHWKVVDFARSEYLEKKASPNIRRITQGIGMNTKDLYTLFPKAPARTVAKIAGIPKPMGCL